MIGHIILVRFFSLLPFILPIKSLCCQIGIPFHECFITDLTYRRLICVCDKEKASCFGNKFQSIPILPMHIYNDFGYGKKIQYIPKLPFYIRNVDITDASLPVISSTTFQNISKLKLESLTLRNNNVVFVEADAFKNLVFLETLHFERETKLTVDEIAESFESLNTETIYSLILNEMKLSEIKANTFIHLNGSNLKKIDISSNNLHEVDFDVFVGMKLLSDIILRNDSLRNIEFIHKLEMVQSLTLSENLFSEIPDFCEIFSRTSSALPMLETLKLNDNKIVYLGKRKSFKCLPQLKLLDLRGNRIKIIGDNFILSLYSLENLDMSQIGPTTTSITEYAFKSTSLSNLTLANFVLTKRETEDYFCATVFKHCPNLNDLSLSGTKLPTNKTALNELFSHMTDIKTLDISNTGLYFIPDTLSQMTSLKTLNLRGNRISSWNGTRIFGKAKLSYLSLKENSISVINDTSFSSTMLSDMKNGSLDLSNNPYLCICATLDSVNWFRRHADILVNYPNDYHCNAPSDVIGILLKDFNPSPESCAEKNIALILSVPVSIVAVTIITTIILVYKCRWRLRYGIFLCNNRYKNYKRIDGQSGFVYAGFVIYSDDDRTWVHNDLINRMENREGFRLCIRLRDFDVGKVHVDNIVDNMFLSEKIIVILSNNFANDDWCHFQLLLAETKLLKQNTDMLVILMLDGIHSDCLRTSLYKLVTENRYALWSNDETGNELFWEQAVSQMRRQTVIN